jgi:hypothetical protein
MKIIVPSIADTEKEVFEHVLPNRAQAAAQTSPLIRRH